jgi:SAM-dependent methyltransferase
MTQWVSFCKPRQEQFEGRRIMTDPGVHSAVVEEVERSLARGAQILDIGAGTGALSLRLHRMGYGVRAVDIDESVFDVPEVPFTRIGSETLLSEIFGEEKFGALVATEVIEHVRSTSVFLREAVRLLTPGGYLFLTTPNLCSIYGRLVFLKEGRFFHFQGPGSWKMGHINPVPFFVIEQTAQEMGFELVSRRGIGYMPIVDWSAFRWRSIFTAVLRLALYLLMSGPGPKEGNCLLYSFRKKA